MNEIREIIILAGLAGNSYLDFRKRQVSLIIIFLMAVSGIVIKICSGNAWTWDSVYALIPGICGLIAAKLTREGIGYGDADSVLALGFLMYSSEVLETSMFALATAGIAALFLIVIRKKSRKYEIPFLPFLLAGYELMLLSEI